MGNAIEYECKECTYWEAIHGINGFNFHDEKYRKCSHCTKPTRDRLEGKGIYPAKVRSVVEGHGIPPSRESLEHREKAGVQ